jgi:hypothetical protein
MRMMLILFGAAAFVYFVTGIKGRFTVRKRLYFAMGTYIIVYLITMILVFTVGNP